MKVFEGMGCLIILYRVGCLYKDYLPSNYQRLLQKMNKRNVEELTLNSYKVDTTSLHNSIKQLNSMKEELETTISHYRSNQSNFIEESERLKDEIQMLQRKLQDRPPDHDRCKEKIDMLEKEVRKSKEEVIKYQEMYEVQRKNHEELRSFYEKKLQNWKGDHHLLVNKYEQRINNLASQIHQIKAVSVVEKEKKSFHSKRQSVDENHSSSDNIDSVVHLSHQKVSKNGSIPSKLPPMPHKTNPTRVEEEPDEELFEASIRRLFYSIKEMGISSREVTMLPQMRKMKMNSSPTKKDCINFMRSPPIEEKDKNTIEKNISYLEYFLDKKDGKMNGQAIVEFIVEKVEEYEMAEKLNSQDISVSGITPSLRKTESYGLMSMAEQKEQLKDKKHYIQNGTLKIESEGSLIR